MTERERRRKIIDHLKAGEAQDAADELAGSREAYPGDGILHHAIGLALASGGTLGAAREQLETAAHLSPDSALILADLAQVRLALGHSEEAMDSAETALGLDPSLAIAHFTLGRACFAAECARQARHQPDPEPGFDFPVVDGRAPLYLRALREMEVALDDCPPFVTAVRGALAFAYLRAGHFHAALRQLQQELAELPPSEEAARVADRVESVEHEIARERYWAAVSTLDPALEPLAVASPPEERLRLAHACAVAGDEERLAALLAEAREVGYGPRPAVVSRLDAPEEIFNQLTDVHAFIGGGLECVVEGELRFLPFESLRAVTLERPGHWRRARVELAAGGALEVAVPSLYRLSLRSPNDLIQSGRFTQFRYAPGETRYARAVGSRNLATEDSVIPFTELKRIQFV